MLSTVIKSVLRQAYRHPLYVGLNVFGLALGIGVFLTLAQLVRFEYSFNTNFADADRIVRIDERWSEPGTTPYESADTTFRAIPFLKQDFPQIEEAIPLMGTTVRVEREGHFITFTGKMTDPAFFRIFPLPLLHENTGKSLTEPDSLILSKSAALSLFGTIDTIGKTVTINQSGEKSTHVVTGVLAAISGPGLLDGVEMILPIPPQMKEKRSCFLFWGSSCSKVFLKLKNKKDINALRDGLPNFVERRASGGADDRISLGPHPEKVYALSAILLRDLHFHDAAVQDADEGVNQNVVDSIGLIGLLALLLACANTVNLATARAGMRAREVALRKTLGASRSALFTQFMGEALLISLIAGVVGMAVCEVLVPIMASMTGDAIHMDYGFILWALPLIVIGCGVASGVYPALVLSGYQPATILAATRMPSGGRRAAMLRNALVAGQFSIAVCIVICTLVIDQQTRFLRTADRGYVKSGLLVGQQMETDDIGLQRRMFDTLRAVPGVTSIAFGELEPDPHSQTRTNFAYNSPGGAVEAQLLQDRISPGYRETYRPRVLAGRWFDSAHGQDDSPLPGESANTTRNVILNEKAVRAYGFSSPAEAIGKVLHMDKTPYEIVGVISDIRFGSPRETVPPEILTFSTLTHRGFDNPVPAVRFKGVPRSVMAERLNRAWRTLRPDIASNFVPADELMEPYYAGDERRGHLFTMGAVAALFIACLGLYGLAAFAAARRFHEIGIRKTLGATAPQIIRLLVHDFLRPVLLACLIACPVAWVLMRRWLSEFDERIALNPAYFLIGISGAVIIAVLTVLGQTLRLAQVEPARALRAEG
ncbi:ABC transporter permease [Acetobacter senegalensis]|uniref:ABC transporter permease n=1 Tax=Acetobacter senegalensis TaxID=446692 RepID=UPI00264FB5C2|nr:ABC transporter permease [Acetobacter senegalensis]MDN7355704.1 ABC transporter permease [Acetobacter senegalensis]